MICGRGLRCNYCCATLTRFFCGTCTLALTFLATISRELMDSGIMVFQAVISVSERLIVDYRGSTRTINTANAFSSHVVVIDLVNIAYPAEVDPGATHPTIGRCRTSVAWGRLPAKVRLAQVSERTDTDWVYVQFLTKRNSPVLNTCTL